MIGSGIFIVPAEMSRLLGGGGWLLGCVGRDRRVDDRGGHLLRRTGFDDAGSRWHVRLPPRGLFSALGLPLWLDAFHRYPNRNNCGCCGGFRSVCGSSVPGYRGDVVHHPSNPYFIRLCPFAFHRASGCDCRYCFADLDEQFRRAVRKDCPKPVYGRQNRRPCRSDPARHFCGQESSRDVGKFRALLGTGQSGSHHVDSDCRLGLRVVYCHLYLAIGFYVFGRLLARHHLRCGRGERPEANACRAL